MLRTDGLNILRKFMEFASIAYVEKVTSDPVVTRPCDPVVTWSSKVPRCFRKLISKTRPARLHYFSNAKSWMTTAIMEVILGRLDRQFKQENRHVLLFFDNAPCHP